MIFIFRFQEKSRLPLTLTLLKQNSLNSCENTMKIIMPDRHINFRIKDILLVTLYYYLLVLSANYCYQKKTECRNMRIRTTICL